MCGHSDRAASLLFAPQALLTQRKRGGRFERCLEPERFGGNGEKSIGFSRTWILEGHIPMNLRNERPVSPAKNF